MKTLLWKMLFIVNASPYLTGQKFGKHVYVQNRLKWYAAQQYCQTKYADLSPLSTSWEEKQLRKATLGKVSGEFWIGLYKTGTYWKWSGGGYETSIVWDESQPSTYYDLFVRVCWDGCTMRTGWFASSLLRELPFFCFSTTVMEEKMAWEEALEYCKETHTTLTSLTSETENLLTLKEIQQGTVTDRVWIGLCFLADRWLWVDGSPLIYEAWSVGDREHQCPGRNYCGAINKNGVWENLDCKEKLSFICV